MKKSELISLVRESLASRNLYEIGDLSIKPYSWNKEPASTNMSDYTFYHFESDSGTKYQVVFARVIAVDKQIIANVAFVAKRKGDQTSSTDVLTGDNEPMKILATVVDIAKAYVDEQGDIDKISFMPSARKSPGKDQRGANVRRDLYKKIIKHNFPKARISGVDNIYVHLDAYKGQKLNERFTEGSFVDPKLLGIDPEKVEVELYDNGTSLTLSRIRVLGPKKQGLGSKAMRQIVNYADANDRTIYLTPSADDGASSVGRLKKFYKRFGFEKNQDKIQSRDTMVRFPQ